jgi:hypothetical protein
VNGLRDAVKAFGVVPLLLVVAGWLLPGRWAKVSLLVGVVYGLTNVLLSEREVVATVTADEPTITYHSDAVGLP